MKTEHGRLTIMFGVLLAASFASAQDYTIAAGGGGGPIQMDVAGDYSTGSGCVNGSVWDECGMEQAYGGGGCGAGGCGNWFFSLNGLIFNRDNDDDVLLTFQTGDGEPLLTSRSAEMQWSGGFEARFGRYFNGGCNAIEAGYWGIYPSAQTATTFGATALAALATPLVFDSLFIDPAGANTPVADFFNNTAEMHQLRRSYEVHNIEVNLLGLAGFGAGGCGGCGGGGCGGCGSCSGASCGGCGGGVAFTWLMGPRFLRFREDFLYSTDLLDTTFTGTPEELHYLIDVDNNLYGFQLGGRADWCLGRRLGLYSGVKFGAYGNEMQHRQAIFDGVGNVAEVNDPASPFDGEVYDVGSRKSDFAMLGELDLGAAMRLSECWSLNIGYRVVGISGVALAPSQIPRDFFDNLQNVRRIESNGDLILHGGYAGLNFNY